MTDGRMWNQYLNNYTDADIYTPVEDTAWYDQHDGLYDTVPDLLNRVPADFDTELQIESIDAADIFGMGEVLASSVENQVADSLNRLKPDFLEDKYDNHEFIRQSQTFPDILLKDRDNPGSDPVMGIELKCWYLLAKEGEPSLRFKTTVNACAPQDLLVFYPWTLDSTVTGRPEIYRPFIMPAQFASLFIDYYWQDLKNWQDEDPNKSIARPGEISPYPVKSDRIQDKPAQDDGGNYGRFRRKVINELEPLENYMDQMFGTELLGIPAKDWAEFYESAGDREDETITELTDLSEVGDVLADNIRDAGYESPQELKNTLAKRLSDEIHGIGENNANEIINSLSQIKKD